ncbi:hypothetical protein ES288_D05G440700v1 [Gossypium darwinii]|uniref:RNase H type-1 domain-containing protein n=1 Tax=Gossypium darwinii TaxID=34276 RepID=A0A5D2CUU0_GOSDA|nr:hypothetical protein ES288_D05G440700v1 [Gossypium darwinii]
MNGSSRGCLRKTEMGGVLGDKNGCVLALCSGPMGEGYAANAKLLAIENGLEIFGNSGWVGCKHLVIESDPMLSISLFKRVDTLVNAIGSINFMYVSRESNSWANELAK